MLILAFIIMQLFFPGIIATGRGKNETSESEILSDWICTKNNRGIVLFERWVKVNDHLSVRERKGEMVIDCEFGIATKYLSQSNTIKDWMKGITTVESLDNKGKPGELVYMVFELPWPFENRDLVAHYNTFYTNNSLCFVKINGENNTKPKQANRTRIKDYQASWRIEKLSNTKTRIVLTTFSSEPPLFPLWVQDPVVKSVFYNNLLRLKNRLTANRNK